jgi:hypothetical protein
MPSQAEMLALAFISLLIIIAIYAFIDRPVRLMKNEGDKG